MANDRLRDALLRQGVTPAQLADEVGVDAKTVERWITLGRVPYARHRHKVAAHVQQSEAYLWPDALSAERAAQLAASEIVEMLPEPSSCAERTLATAA